MKSTQMKEEMQKLKTMSGKDKCWYIWEYYKIPILIGLGVIFLLVTLLPSIINRKDPVYTCYIINNPIFDDSYTTLKDGFTTYANIDPKEEWDLDSSMVIDLQNSMDSGYEYYMKITAVIAAKGLDTMIGDQEVIENYSVLAGLLNLQETLPADILDLVDSRLYYVTNEEGESIPCAIEVTDSAALKNAGIRQDTLYFSIVGNSPHIDMSILFLKYLLNL